ncbi:hypothetical protein I4U23_020271 [Adineta vaga]|nr:hypothetical protein I4U23_020271 [Adineta vaga]
MIKVVVFLFFVFFLVSLTALSITSLIMSTGKFWKCPGEPRLFQWLLGFGIYGILICWQCIILAIERYVDRDIYRQRRPTLVFCVVMIILLQIFVIIWSMIGVSWTNTKSLTDSSYYYIDGKNIFCHSTIFKFTKGMSLMVLIGSALIITTFVYGLKIFKS